MVYKMVDGYGVRVIDGTRLDAADSSIIGSKAEIFTQNLLDLTTSAASWAEKFQPRLVMHSDGYYRLENSTEQCLKSSTHYHGWHDADNSSVGLRRICHKRWIPH